MSRLTLSKILKDVACGHNHGEKMWATVMIYPSHLMQIHEQHEQRKRDVVAAVPVSVLCQEKSVGQIERYRFRDFSIGHLPRAHAG